MTKKKKPQISWTPEKISLLKKEYPNGDKKRLCEIFGISYTALKCSAQRFNVRSEIDVNLYKLKPLIDDTCYNFYWYGFIMSDGFISDSGELKFCLHEKDSEHLKKLTTYLNVNIFYETVKTRYGTCNICKMSCKDAHYGKLLKNKLNITKSKTYSPPILDFIENKEQFLSFFAGFLDGDGTFEFKNNKIQTLKINCHGSWIVNFNFFKKCLSDFYDIKSTTTIDSRGYSLIRICNSSSILKISDEMRKLNIPYLNRKWRIDEEN